MSQVQRGKLKCILVDKAYGFITAEDGRDFFFHRAEMKTPHLFHRLEAGDSMLFTANPPRAGTTNPCATDVCVVQTL